MRHHAIIVTCWNEQKIEAAHKRALEIFRAVSPILKSQMNHYCSFFIPPDGSKEGWSESDAGDSLRDAMIEWLNDQAYKDGSTSFDWIEVQYGDDERVSKIIRHSDQLWLEQQSLKNEEAEQAEGSPTAPPPMKAVKR
jgi:hypothetical protein